LQLTLINALKAPHKFIGPLVLLIILCSVGSNAQTIFQAQAGVGYIEHLSLGIGCNFSNKHSLSLLYGSNVFIRPKNFSSYLLQYTFNFNKLKFKNITPAVGIKGGTTIFTDEYYRWNVLAIIPFVELHYPLNNRFDLYIQGGCAFSFEQSVKRIKDGEIGQYKDFLPEFKTGVRFNLNVK
jgi:hypothetical protein